VIDRLSNRLEQLDAELRDILAGRKELGPAFPLMMEAWHGAATRELARLEFPPSEISELLGARLRALAPEFSTGVDFRGG
jgi:hypothetical protein